MALIVIRRACALFGARAHVPSPERVARYLTHVQQGGGPLRCSCTHGTAETVAGPQVLVRGPWPGQLLLEGSVFKTHN